ncbi:MAG: hypothetical protein H5T95_04960 [Firmicutes bacterium]|nr:hypothetical protein [Bacillota bacterium]
MSGLAGEHPRSKGESGTVFLAVLVAVAVLGVLAAAAMTIAANAYKASTWARDRAKALYAAEAGINRWLFLCDSGEATLSDLDGSIDGVAYTVSCAQSSDDASVYLLRSSASTGWHTCEVSVAAKSSPEAWQHVVFAGGNIEKESKVELNPESGPNGPVAGVLPPMPDWDKYRNLLEPDLLWTIPSVMPGEPINGEVKNLPGPGPHYYENEHIKTVSNITGDLYLRNCTVDKIVGPIRGNLFISGGKVGPVTGDILGSVYIEDADVSETNIGDADTVIRGDIEIRVPFTGSSGPKRGGGADGDGITVMGRVEGTVFLEGCSLTVKGATVCGSLYTSKGVTLTDGCTIDSGIFIEGDVVVWDEVVVGHRENLPAIMAQEDVEIMGGKGSKAGILSVDGVVWVGGEVQAHGATLKVETGCVAVLGRVHLTGSGGHKLHYDYGLLDPRNQPPHFTGGKTRLSLLRDTWRSSYQSAE